MSLQTELQDAHRARRAKFFPPKYRKREPKPEPAVEEVTPEPDPQTVAQIYESNLDRLIREAQRLGVGDYGPRPPVRVHDVLRITAGFYNVKTNDIRSERRTANIVRPRQIAMYLSKELTLSSLVQVGRVFGDRDHTTVLHAINKIGKLRETDARLSDELELIQRRIAEHFEVPA